MNNFQIKYNIKLKLEGQKEVIKMYIPSSSPASTSFCPLECSFPSPCALWKAFAGGKRLRSSSTMGITLSSVGSLSNTFSKKTQIKNS